MHFSLVPYKIAMAALRLSESKCSTLALYKKEKKKKKALWNCLSSWNTLSLKVRFRKQTAKDIL